MGTALSVCIPTSRRKEGGSSPKATNYLPTSSGVLGGSVHTQLVGSCRVVGRER